MLDEAELKVAVVVCTATAREARERHQLAPVSATLLAQGLSAGALLASLQKGESRINLQLEVDGPLRGLFVDAHAAGALRGYVKNPHLDVELAEGPFRWRAALGNSGFLSVLRDAAEGEFYRSSVELRHLDLALDLNHYFETSDQVPTRVALQVQRRGPEGLGAVAGVMVQALPHGDRSLLSTLGQALSDDLARALEALPEQEVSASALLNALFQGRGLRPLEGTTLGWRCPCSKARVLDALAALGPAEVREMLTQPSTVVVCQFCAARHEISREDLAPLAVRSEDPKN